VADTIPLEVQMFLWSLLDNLIAKIELDNLHVFELSKEGGRQKIIHSQEVPEYQMVYQFNNVVRPLKNKLYVIDDGEYCTMLLPEER
jgi:hypothetical protein